MGARWAGPGPLAKLQSRFLPGCLVRAPGEGCGEVEAGWGGFPSRSTVISRLPGPAWGGGLLWMLEQPQQFLGGCWKEGLSLSLSLPLCKFAWRCTSPQGFCLEITVVRGAPPGWEVGGPSQLLPSSAPRPRRRGLSRTLSPPLSHPAPLFLQASWFRTPQLRLFSAGGVGVQEREKRRCRGAWC